MFGFPELRSDLAAILKTNARQYGKVVTQIGQPIPKLILVVRRQNPFGVLRKHCSYLVCVPPHILEQLLVFG